jgi:hypothetical protein
MARPRYRRAMYAVYNVKASDRGEVEAILADKEDDLISRQSVTIRDAESIGLADLALLVLIEGTEDALKSADKRFDFAEKLDAGKAEEARKAIQAQEDDAASGMGMIFGN